MDLKHKLKDLVMSEFAYDLSKYEDEGEAKVNNIIENLVKLFSLYIVSQRSELLEALKGIERECDNQNPTHENIWRIAYGAIKDSNCG